MNNDIKSVLYSEEAIREMTKKLGKQITEDYKDKKPLVVCILTGAVLFMTDLVREIDTYLEMDFMDVSSYGDGTVSTGDVKIIKDLDKSVKGRDVLIVEDIIDTGKTLQRITEILSMREANSIKVCTLFDKPARRTEDDIKADYVGFEVPNEFIVGYGLDYAGVYRNLPYVGVLKPEVYENN